MNDGNLYSINLFPYISTRSNYGFLFDIIILWMVHSDETKKECNNEEIKINGSNRNHDNDGVKDVPVVDS